jgi:hypothetical protein
MCTRSASPLNSVISTSDSAQTLRMVCSQKVSIAPVNTGRRYLVTNTICARSRDTLWRAPR